MEIVSAAILLFLIMDPLGNIPVFLSLLKALPPARRRLVLARELLIALAVLLLFLYSGQAELGYELKLTDEAKDFLAEFNKPSIGMDM